MMEFVVYRSKDMPEGLLNQRVYIKYLCNEIHQCRKKDVRSRNNQADK